MAARHALADRVEEWKATSNHSTNPEDVEYSLKVRSVMLRNTFRILGFN